MAPLAELESAFERFRRDRRFRAELDDLLHSYAGRPTPLSFAERLTARAGGAKIALKREDLLHTGAHKLNNSLGQVLLARRMGKTRIVAETGAGQHGVATAAAAAKLGLPCRVYMGAIDMERQAPNVSRMRLLGAEVVAVDSGSRTLKDAINEAMRDWTENVAHATTCSARRSVRIRIRRSCGSSSRSSARRRARSSASSRDATPTPRWPAWAADRTRSASSRPTSRPRGRSSTASRREAAVPVPATTLRAFPAARSESCTGRSRCCCRTKRARSCPPTRSRRASTIPRSAPSTPA